MDRDTLAMKLKGGDLRMLLGADSVAKLVKTQTDFDALFTLLFHHDRRVVMRAADAVEKITRTSRTFLSPHTGQLLELLNDHANIEVRWHLAQLLPRLALDANQLTEVWQRLRYWAANRNESKLVRVHALQGLFDLMQYHGQPYMKPDFRALVAAISKEHIPSIDARVRSLRARVPRKTRRIPLGSKRRNIR